MSESEETRPGLDDRSQEQISRTQDAMNLPAVAPARLRFVLVNDVAPQGKAQCALCGTVIDQPYLRELHTGLHYCDPQCLAGHQTLTRAVRKLS